MNDQISYCQIHDIARRLGVSLSTVFKFKRHDPRFPRAVSVPWSTRLRLYVVSEVDVFLQQLAADRESAA